MKKHITFVAIAALAAAALSFGCSDSGGGGEIPDVSGSYTVKTSTCPFTTSGGVFSVSQSTSNKEMLAISLGYVMYDDMKATAPDFYEVPSVPGGTAKKAAIVSANVSVGGGLTAQITYGDATYDCGGTFKKDGDTKKADFNCNTGSATCSFSAEGNGTTPNPNPSPEPTPGEGEENGPCINDVGCVSEGMGCWSVMRCNEGLICDEANDICKKPATPPVKGEENGACNDDGTCNKPELTCTDNVCIKKTPLTCSEGAACPAGTECKDGACVNIPTPGTKKFGDICTATSECGANLLCTEGKCAWDPNFVIPFADDNLKKGINNALGKGEVTTDITVGDCDSLPNGIIEYDPALIYDQVIGWHCSDNSNVKLKSLKGLEYCTKLKDLELHCNEITDIQPITGLTGLTKLSLGHNQIISITPLSGLMGLTQLYLSHNKITNIQPIAGLTKLTKLHLYHNQISNINPVSGLTDLTNLALRENLISNIQSLAELKKLTHLDLQINQISDITPVKNLVNMNWLSLGGNQLKNLPTGVFSGMANLQDLDLGYNQLTSLPINIFTGLGNLERLYLRGNRITSIAAISDLPKLNYLDLQNNCVYKYKVLSDTGLGKEDILKVSDIESSCNKAFPLEPPDMTEDMKKRIECIAGNALLFTSMQARGVKVTYGPASTAQCN